MGEIDFYDRSRKTTVPAIAGNAQIAFADGIPTLTTTETSNSSSITINFTASSDVVTSKTFYFPLPVAEYPALELSIGNGATSKVLKTKALDAKRNERYTTTITLDEVSGSVPTTVESVSEVADALKKPILFLWLMWLQLTPVLQFQYRKRYTGRKCQHIL